jgi:hypothetical protein
MPLVSVDAQAIPKLHTSDASTLISDESGITRYRVEAKVWDIYSNKGDGYWYFPKGIYAEQFDSLFHVTASIVADTAYYFEKKELWRAIGNVVVKNMEGRTFETSELFWDQKVPSNVVNAFYTNQMVKIVDPDGNITYGRNGFKADQSLNTVRLYSGNAELNVSESTDTLQQHVNRPDTLPHP